MTSSLIAKEERKFEQYLLKAGLRVSRGRAGVFKEVMNAHGHFTAEEIAKSCGRHKPGVSRATVYRSLREMLEAGVVRETAFGEKHQHFEHIYDEKPHHHARCIRCHGVVEFADLGEDSRYHSVLAKKGFKVIGHEMHFYGICRDCQEKI